MAEYTKCPCTEPLVSCGAGVFRCRTVPENAARPDENSRWIPYLAAWVCLPGWAKYRTALRLGRKAPQVNPAAIEATRTARLAMRPSSVDRFINRHRA